MNSRNQSFANATASAARTLVLLALCIGGMLAPRSSADITTGLLSLYRFDDNTVNDSSGNGNHGVIRGSPLFVTGAVGKGIKLNGTTDWVDIGPDVFLDAFTFAAWARADGTALPGSQDMTIIGDGGSPDRYFLGISGENGLYRGTAGNSLYSTTAPTIGQFYHVAFTRDVTGICRLYVNGVLDRTLDLGLLSPGGSTNLQLGSIRNNIEFFNGVIDEARIYNRALSAAEIQVLATVDLFSISGNVAVAGPFALRRIVIAESAGSPLAVATDSAGNYTLPALPGAASYTLRAFLDINGSGQRDAWEPEGTYAGNPIVLTGVLQGTNITISQTPADTDNDGMADGWEMEFGLNVGTNDASLDKDSDGLSNIHEYYFGSKPNQTYSAGDGIADIVRYNSGGNPLSADSDGDGMSDAWELMNGLNPLVNDAALDADGDGLTNSQEFAGGKNPHLPDNPESITLHAYDRIDRLVATNYANGAWEAWRYDGNGNIRAHAMGATRDADGDGLLDSWELTNGLSFNLASGTQGFGGDADGDGWTNYQEFLADTDPNDAASHPPTGGVVGAAWFNPPKARILFPPTTGGGFSHISVKLWDAEGNPAQTTLQWFDSTMQQWKPATVTQVDGAVFSGTPLATTPAGTPHDFLWNALADLGAFNGVIQLRATVQDAAGTTTSEIVPFTVNTTGDFDGDCLPDSWEIAKGLDPNDATGPNGATADLDGDGLTAFAEFAFNRNPSVADSAGVPTVTTAVNPSDGQTYLMVTYQRRTGASGMLYEIQTTSDLAAWATNGADLEPVSVIPNGEMETATVRIHPPLGTPATPVKFVRIRVRTQ